MHTICQYRIYEAMKKRAIYFPDILFVNLAGFGFLELINIGKRAIAAAI